MIKTKDTKKDVKTHCCNNRIPLDEPLKCDWCIQGDKRKDGLFHNCRSYYFHLKYCAKNVNFSLNPTLEEKIQELQKLSDKIILEGLEQ